jgi:predicted amidohydrolase YtcJ
VSGRTVGGLLLYDEKNRLDRAAALSLYALGSSWFSGDEGKKGGIAAGQFADLAVLSADFFTVPENEIKRIEAVLTIMGGKLFLATASSLPWHPPCHR